MWVLHSDLTAAAALVASSFLLRTLRHDLMSRLTLDSILILLCFDVSKFGHVQHWMEMHKGSDSASLPFASSIHTHTHS